MKNNAKIEHLIDLYEDGGTEALAELNQMLREDAELRSQFSCFLVDEEILREELKLEQIEKIVESENVIPFKRDERKGAMRGFTMGAAAAAVILGITGVLTWPRAEQEDSSSSVVHKEETSQQANWIAKLVTTTPGTSWDGGEKTIGANFEKGEHNLLTGEVMLEFSNEVELVVKAPAKFQIKSPFEVVLNKGVVRAKVSEAGYGFVVDTPKTKVRDLGTEFGVSVGEGLDTEVHVFNGEVELYDPDGSAPELAQDGFAASWQNGERTSIDVGDDEAFPTRRSIDFKNWQAYSDQLKQDSSLEVSYTFSGRGNLLENAVSGSSVQAGQIHNPTWVRGRWSGTKALLFDSNRQWVDVDLPVMNESFTLQTWIKPDRFDNSLQVILNSDVWVKGRHHWQFTNDGKLRVGLGDKFGFVADGKRGEIELGKWTQLSMVFDQPKQELRYYVNGKLSISTSVQLDYIDLGKSQIGAWSATSKGRPRRNFSGRMDEFTLRRRVVSPREISESYHKGLIH